MKYLLLILNLCISVTLQEAYDNANPYNEYEKYIVLEPNQIYTGGIGIYEGDIFIDCQGSIIDLQGQSGIWVYADEDYNATLDIQYCNIINGAIDLVNSGLTYGGIASGKIINCNFYNNNIGLKPCDESEVQIENCNFIDNNYGIGIISETPIVTISYSNSWNNENDYWENCPG